MKTHKFFLTVVLCGIAFGTSRAQSNYYTTARVIQGNGYSYQCDSYGGLVDLYNSTNPYTYAAQTLKDGTPVDYLFFDQSPFDFNWQAEREKAQQLAWQVFTAAELQSFRNPAGQFLEIILYINSDTGRVVEVGFVFSTRFGYANIPIEKFRQIELAIKKNVAFHISAFGKQLNYCITDFTFDPGSEPPVSIAQPKVSTGIDFVLTNNTDYRLDIESVALWGYLGQEYTSFIDSRPGAVGARSSIGLPAGRGREVSAPVGTPIDELGLELCLSPLSAALRSVRVTAWIEGSGGSDSEVLTGDHPLLTYLELRGSKSLTPRSGRLTLHIDISYN